MYDAVRASIEPSGGLQQRGQQTAHSRMDIESALEKFGLDTEDFDEGLIESANFLIDFSLSQFSEVGVGPRVACFGDVSRIG